MQQQARKPLHEYQKEVKQCLHTLEHLLGRNNFHEHQKIVGYLEGWLSAFRFVETYNDE